MPDVSFYADFLRSDTGLIKLSLFSRYHHKIARNAASAFGMKGVDGAAFDRLDGAFNKTTVVQGAVWIIT
jgi:hypothetical protein